MAKQVPMLAGIVVGKGSWALGMGTHFNRETLVPMYELSDQGVVLKVALSKRRMGSSSGPSATS